LGLTDPRDRIVGTRRSINYFTGLMHLILVWSSARPPAEPAKRRKPSVVTFAGDNTALVQSQSGTARDQDTLLVPGNMVEIRLKSVRDEGITFPRSG
jgi:hypothetical protein